MSEVFKDSLVIDQPCAVTAFDLRVQVHQDGRDRGLWIRLEDVSQERLDTYQKWFMSAMEAWFLRAKIPQGKQFDLALSFRSDIERFLQGRIEEMALLEWPALVQFHDAIGQVLAQRRRRPPKKTKLSVAHVIFYNGKKPSLFREPTGIGPAFGAMTVETAHRFSSEREAIDMLRSFPEVPAGSCEVMTLEAARRKLVRAKAKKTKPKKKGASERVVSTKDAWGHTRVVGGHVTVKLAKDKKSR